MCYQFKLEQCRYENNTLGMYEIIYLQREPTNVFCMPEPSFETTFLMGTSITNVNKSCETINSCHETLIQMMFACKLTKI